VIDIDDHSLYIAVFFVSEGEGREGDFGMQAKMIMKNHGQTIIFMKY